MYSGRVSLVTYVVAVGLALVGAFAGALGVSSMAVEEVGTVIIATRFVYDAVPWLTVAALTASTGRLLDELIGDDDIGSAYVNLPFVAVAVGLAVRGFSVYFLERSGVFQTLTIQATEAGPVSFDAIDLTPAELLAVLVLASILISLVGVRVAAYVSGNDLDVGLEERRS
jgi:putative membrane protein